jgi:hypothetical protein
MIVVRKGRPLVAGGSVLVAPLSRNMSRIMSRTLSAGMSRISSAERSLLSAMMLRTTFSGRPVSVATRLMISSETTPAGV